jgi:hypothetical protein
MLFEKDKNYFFEKNNFFLMKKEKHNSKNIAGFFIFEK